MIETVLTVLAIGFISICLFGSMVICYVWFLFYWQVKAIRKERELKSHHGEGH